jgi:hypothetical protein
VSDSLASKIGKIVLSEKTDLKKQTLWTDDITPEKLRLYLPALAESLSKKNPEEDERKTGREGKEFIPPINYAVIEGNNVTFVGGSFNKRVNMGKDVGDMIFWEILNHGRQTPEEMCKHIGAVDRTLLQIIINAMLQDEHLDVFVEGDGVKTLELVDAKERIHRLTESKTSELTIIDEENRYYLAQLPPTTAAYEKNVSEVRQKLTMLKGKGVDLNIDEEVENFIAGVDEELEKQKEEGFDIH